MSLAFADTPDRHHQPDRILLVGGGAATLDLLRLATIRSDDVVLLAEQLDEPARRYAERFAVDWQRREAIEADFVDATSILVTLDDMAAENIAVRQARRHGRPVHVRGRPLVSNFSLLEFLERRSSTERL